MAYQVIARKYRPQRFSDVVGQEHVTQTLANAIEQQRIAHAYLFVGPRGTGKTTIARIFAKCLNSTNGPRVDFDDQDARCIEISEGRSLDVLEIDGASNRGIEEIRELRDTVKYAPANSRFKVYIIDEVHMLTKEAFNALLKTLEEPPSHVKFMFATTEPEKVLPTILSRCQRFDLRRIPIPLISKHLAFIAEREGVQVDEAARYAIARGAEGCMRDAESTLDQLISFCGSRIVEGDVLSMFGLAARSQIHRLAHDLLVGDAGAVLKSLDDLVRQGKELGRFLSELLNHFRNLLLWAISGGDTSMLELAESDSAALATQVKLTSADALMRVLEALVGGEARLRDSVSRRVALEVVLLQAIQARNAVSIDTVLNQLQLLRRSDPAMTAADAGRQSPAGTTTTTISAGSAQVDSLPGKTPAPVVTKPAVAAELIIAAVPVAAAGGMADQWARVLDAVGANSPMIRSWLAQAHPVACENQLLTLGHDPALTDQIHSLDNAKNRELVLAKMREVGFAVNQFKFVPVKPDGPAAPAEPAAESTPASKPAPAPRARAAEERKVPEKPPAKSAEKTEPASLDLEAFKNDPLIKQALEIFKGQIASVAPGASESAEQTN